MLLSLPLMKDTNKLVAMSILFVFTAICTSLLPLLPPWVTTMVRSFGTHVRRTPCLVSGLSIEPIVSFDL
jgi:hypothetical protein